MDKYILLVDDDADDLAIFMDAYKRCGLELPCIIARNGQECLDILQSNPVAPQLIFSDINMPKMDGWQLLARLKAHAEYSTIPVVMLTTNATDAARQKSAANGAHHFVTKPDTFTGLIQLIGSIFGVGCK